MANELIRKGYTIGQHMKWWRYRRDLTMGMAGDLIGVSESCISRWESGERTPSAGNTRLIADAYDVPLDTVAMILVLRHKQKL
jgi:transcriptional regulator with XRE-family HTH domain